DSENPEYESVTEPQTLNSMIPIWQRPKKEVTEEEYEKFYHDKFMSFDKPAKIITTSVEGVVTYKALLYIPSKTPYDYYTKEYKKGLQLYSSGVLIMENCEELLPEHFRFVKGVVDSQDFSLNISREVLQHDHQLKTVAQTLEKKIKNELASMLKKDRETYENFFREFGRQIKYGIVSDYGMHKDTLKDLLMFYSSNSEKMTTLAEYVDRMPEEQKYIYFATGENVNAISKLPQAEKVLSKGYELLYCTQDVDEFTIQSLMQYNEKQFKSVDSDDLGIEDENDSENTDNYDNVTKFVKDALGDKVSEVVASKKLISHPVCMTAKGGISFEMEKYFASVQPEAGMKAQRCLELNMNHKAVEAMIKAIDTDEEKAKKYAQILYNQSLLIAGLPIDDPSEYADLVCSIME
ncbi:MAG: molecular chaperone HtpG, partial [Ruminococcus sp.]